jgi:Protein of unknown function (DUF1376)
MTALAPPPVQTDLDLRDFQYMPLDVLRLRDSDLATLATGDEFKAAVLLWCAAWHQVPAGSVPNDDRWLARHSGAGPSWRKVKAEALRGFVEHADGRLYHPVVVEKATASWRRKCEQKVRTLKARIVAAERRLAKAETDDDRAHIRAMLTDLRRGLPQAIERSVTDSGTHSVTGGVTSTKGEGEGEVRDSSKGRDISKGEQSSEAKASGAGAPVDKSKVTFGDCLAYLVDSGKDEKHARSLLGKWRRDHGDDAVQAAIDKARAGGISDPVPYIQACLAGGGRRGVPRRVDGWEAQP